MTRRIVAITGIGTLTPAGRGTEALWTSISSEDTCLTTIDPQRYFDSTHFTCQIAGQVPAFNEPRVLTDAVMEQTDRCSQLAIVAALDALDMAKLPTDFRSANSPVAAERVSLTVATIVAGWTFVEREMRNLWTNGLSAMSRYSMTAGFPAGPQGHVGISLGIEGRTRTIVSERVSGAHALIEGAKAIWRGDADIAIAGGTEAPLTPLVWAAYHSSHLLQPTTEGEVHQRTGMLIGEGSTFLVLEEREHARRRGVPVLAEMSGWSRGTDPDPLEGPGKQPGRILKRTIRTSLAQADIQPADIGVLFSAGPALAQEDVAEEAAIKSTFEPSLLIAQPKTVLGHLLGAATATDVAIATMTLAHQTMPPRQDAHACTDVPISHALVLASGLGGMHASLVVSKA